MYHTDNVEMYSNQVLHQLKQHNIPSRLRALQRVIQDEGLTTKCSEILERIDHQVTTIRLNAGKVLVKPPSVYKATDVAKV